MKPKKPIETLILTIREQRVILAPDLADLYGVETRVLNQGVKRNVERFPEDFIFRLTAEEFSALKVTGNVSSDGRAALRSQIVILEPGRPGEGGWRGGDCPVGVPSAQSLTKFTSRPFAPRAADDSPSTYPLALSL
jgi:hypothetical protein